jgi:hypothetical protein
MALAQSSSTASQDTARRARDGSTSGGACGVAAAQWAVAQEQAWPSEAAARGASTGPAAQGWLRVPLCQWWNKEVEVAQGSRRTGRQDKRRPSGPGACAAQGDGVGWHAGSTRGRRRTGPAAGAAPGRMVAAYRGGRSTRRVGAPR